MLKCQRCSSERILCAYSHGRDCQTVNIGNKVRAADYLPTDLGIGGGDDMEIEVCLNCGQLQGQWPLPLSELEQKE